MKKFFMISVIGFFVFIVSVSIMFVFLLGGDSDSNTQNQIDVTQHNFSDEVLAYQSLLEKYCAEYGIEDYLVYIMAIMQVESGGRGNDVMQASESLGLPLNSLEPEASIKQGCSLFAELLAKADRLGCDIHAVIQSYNFGGGFLDFVAENGGKYSFALAMEFSELYANGVKVDYHNSIAIETNGGWRYDYGNFFYVQLVSQYLRFSEFIWPSRDYFTLTSLFGGRIHPIRGTADNHTGIDIGAAFGSDMLAIANGTVTVAGYDPSYGNFIMIDHNTGYQSLYAHMAQLNVYAGATVTQGQTIGLVGSTGDSTGPHIHLEIWLDGQRVDPLDYYDESIYRF